MKIIKLVNDLGYGGTQRCAQNYALGLKSRGHDVSCYCYGKLGPRAKILEEADIPVGLIDCDKEGLGINLSQADVIHVHREGPYSPKTTALLVALRTLYPQIAIVETNVFSRVDFKIPNGVIDVHFHLSEWCLVKYLKWARGLNYYPQAMVVPYVVDGDSFGPASFESIRTFKHVHNIPEDAFLFGRLGQSSEAKWNTCMIDAFVKAEIDNAYLMLVSAPQSHVQKINSLPSQIRSKIRLAEFLKGDTALRTAFSSFDAFVHTAKIGESFGMVLAESMLCETPVITLSTPLKDNTQTLMIPECNGGVVVRTQQLLIQAMQQVVEDPAPWRALGHGARVKTVARYGFEAIIPRLELGYQRAIALRRGEEADYGDEYKISESLVKNELKKMDVLTRIKFAALHSPSFYKIYRKFRFG